MEKDQDTAVETGPLDNTNPDVPAFDDNPMVFMTREAAVQTGLRAGFLPIETNWFDRIFISVVLWVALSLFWFRFLEPLGLSIWLCLAISVVAGIFIVRKG